MIPPETEEARRALEDGFLAGAEGGPPSHPLPPDLHDLRPEALSAASGITDHALLARLVDAGIEGDTLIALSLMPLVAVAWADGSLDEKEGGAVLQAAADSGLERGGAALTLLQEWLAAPPAHALIETWRAYIRDRSAAMDPEARQALRIHVLGRARRVAEVAGCLLGLHPQVSPAEVAMLERLEAAFRS